LFYLIETCFRLWNDEANSVSNKLDPIRFNWTISYRFDAEVSDCSYGCIFEKKKNPHEALGKKVLFAKHFEETFFKRDSSAVWFVSNCESKKRLEFASELNKYYPINVYGKCADDFNFKSSFYSWFGWTGKFFYKFLNNYKQENCEPSSQCENKNLNSNKFYLSFESKNCSNYITEKFFRILRYNIIPVVFQPKKEFYLQIAPPHSFIHAQDFDNDAKKLGDYLNFLSNNYESYSEYLSWKTEYDNVYSGKMTEKIRMCELCTLLNTDTSITYYDSISKWFNNDCIIN
jgi:alpha-1,3-fucosyltransferase